MDRRKYCRLICSGHREAAKRQQLSFFTVPVNIKVGVICLQLRSLSFQQRNHWETKALQHIPKKRAKLYNNSIPDAFLWFFSTVCFQMSTERAWIRTGKVTLAHMGEHLRVTGQSQMSLLLMEGLLRFTVNLICPRVTWEAGHLWRDI